MLTENVLYSKGFDLIFTWLLDEHPVLRDLIHFLVLVSTLLLFFRFLHFYVSKALGYNVKEQIMS